MPDGSVQLDRKSYPQNWAAYNAAQTGEKAQFLYLLHSLCVGVEEPKQAKGRPRLPVADALFAACYKVFSTVSARRFISDLAEAQAKGYLTKTPHFNSVLNALDNEALTPILYDMIVQTSLPLASVETQFAADSSGFTSGIYDRWYDHKYGVKQQHDWAKLHIMCGVKTNIITAAEIRDRSTNDRMMLQPMLDTTAQNFSMSEVYCDAGYSSAKNNEAILDKMARPFIPFNKNATGTGAKAGRSMLWSQMYHFFKFHQEEFYAHYHRRSNVEATFSMIKRKFGGYVRSKTETAMKNEVLCKVICHNICVLIQESHELGIDISLWKK
jgi:transposase